MRDLVLFLRYFFSINPTSVAHYSDPDILALFGVVAACFVVSFLLRLWHKRQQSLTRKLSGSWSSVAFWFGILGLLLIASRVERIQVLAMPFLWVIWGLGLLTYVFIQWRLFRARHYQVLPQASASTGDPYISGKRRK